VTEALVDDMNHREEKPTPRQDVVVANTVAGIGDVMSLVVVNIIIEDGGAALHLVARVTVLAGTVKNQMVSTPTVTDDVLVAHIEGEGVVMRKI